MLNAKWTDENNSPVELKVGEQEDQSLGDRPIRIWDDILSVFVKC